MDRPSTPRFFFARNGEQFGPFDSKEIRALAATGKLLPADMVWREGMPEWVQASQVKGLFTARSTQIGSADPVAKKASEQPAYSPPNVFQNFGAPASQAYKPQTHAKQTRSHAWTIGEVLSEAWGLTKGFKGTVWLVALALVAMQFAIGYLETAILAGTQQPIFASLVGWAAVIIACWPLGAGLTMLGVHRAAGESVQAGMAFGYYGRWLMIAGVNLLVMIFVALGLVLLIVPGIYLAVAYAFALPLMLDRDVGIWEAMETSRRLVQPVWWKFFFMTLAMSGLFAASVLTLGIALIWLLPMAFTAYGVVYQRVCSKA